MDSLIEIAVNDGVTAKLKTLEDLSFVNAALTAGAVALKAKLAVYPPSQSRPGRYSLRTRRPMGWYKRGTGWMEPILSRQRRGPLLSRAAMGGLVGNPSPSIPSVVIGYRNRRATSETFGRKWAIYSRGPLEVVIGNNTSYGPWAKSAVRVGSAGPQSRLLRAYGWSTVDQDVAGEEKSIVARVESELQKKFGG